MRPSARAGLRRALVGLTAVVALGGAFTLGVVAGAGSADPDDRQGTGGVLDDAASTIAGDGLHPVDRAVLDAAAIRAMLGEADDTWGSWSDAPSPGTPSGYVGVGLWLRRDGAALLVDKVQAGSPASRAGLLPGDAVRAVDDRTTKALDPAAVAAALRGVPGSTVHVVVGRGDALRSLALRRVAVPAAGVRSIPTGSSVVRIVVPAFTQGAGRQVRTLLAAARSRHVTGVVLDLRGDSGGLLTEAVETASAFLDGGPVVSYTRRTGPAQHLDAEGSGDTTTPVVVLVDGGTASAAEVVAGALQDRGRAVVVGTRTFGKGSVQEPHQLPDGSSLALTVARYALPSGRSVEGVGLEPDIEVDVPATTGSDPAVARAVEVLAGLRADAGARP